jgi:hypothetical protein
MKELHALEIQELQTERDLWKEASSIWRSMAVEIAAVVKRFLKKKFFEDRMVLTGLAAEILERDKRAKEAEKKRSKDA